MSITRDDVLKLARLAQLELSAEEVELLARQCSSILGYFEAISGLDVNAVEPTGALEYEAPLREDVEKADPLEIPPQEIAPDWREGFFVLPRLAALDDEATALEAEE